MSLCTVRQITQMSESVSNKTMVCVLGNKISDCVIQPHAPAFLDRPSPQEEEDLQPYRYHGSYDASDGPPVDR